MKVLIYEVIYLRVNLAIVLMGLESKNDDFRLNFRVTPISSRAKKDCRRVTFFPGSRSSPLILYTS